MLNSYYTEKLLGLQGVEIKNITENQEKYEIAIEQPRKACMCPCCGQRTDKIHDYRRQRVKELLYSILDEPEPHKQKKLFADWIKEASDSEIPAFVKCAKTYYNWFTPITNSFICPYTNGFTEGCNNKIKVLKRNAYGLRDFKRFRNRILFMFSHQSHNGA